MAPRRPGRHGRRARRQHDRLRAPTSTRSTNAPTAAMSRWRRSRPSSTPNCCACWRSTPRRCRRRWTARAGRRRRRASPSASAPARAMSGVRCWRAATPASRRCCRWMRRPSIRTTARATRSSRLDGVAQPAPAPRFSRTPLAPPTPPEPPGAADPRAVLADWGVGAAEVESGAGSRAAGLTNSAYCRCWNCHVSYPPDCE